jgi:hypothetical protein
MQTACHGAVGGVVSRVWALEELENKGEIWQSK